MHVSDELCRFKEEEEEDGQFVSSYKARTRPFGNFKHVKS